MSELQRLLCTNYQHEVPIIGTLCLYIGSLNEFVGNFPVLCPFTMKICGIILFHRSFMKMRPAF